MDGDLGQLLVEQSTSMLDAPAVIPRLWVQVPGYLLAKYQKSTLRKSQLPQIRPNFSIRFPEK